MNLAQRLMSNIAEIFAPLIPALIIGGLILGFRNIIGDIKMFDDGTKTLVETSQFFAGVHSFLWLIGEAIFHFLPVGITWSITKKMGTTQILGIILGITLVSPQLLNAYSVAGADTIPFWDFGFAKVNMIGYQAQVIPAILAGFTLVYLEKTMRKISPASISMIIVPLFSLIPAVIIAHVVLGPIGWTIGSWVSNIVYSGLTSSFRSIFAAIFGFLYAPLVITGLHHMTNAIDLQLVAEFGGTALWPMIALSNITEPALFGVNMKYRFPFICGMIGSAVAGIFSVSTGVLANSIGVGGIPGILSIQPQHMFMFLISMLIAIVLPFVLTVTIGKSKLTIK